MPSPAGEGGSRRLTDEAFFPRSRFCCKVTHYSSSTATRSPFSGRKRSDGWCVDEKRNKGVGIYKTLRRESRFRWFVGVGALDDPLRFVDCTLFLEDFFVRFPCRVYRQSPLRAE